MEEATWRDLAYEDDASGPNVVDVPDVEENLTELSDQEIQERISEAKNEAGDIRVQLEDDAEDGFRRGEIWRRRAQSARRHFLADVRDLTHEAIRRRDERREAAKLARLAKAPEIKSKSHTPEAIAQLAQISSAKGDRHRRALAFQAEQSRLAQEAKARLKLAVVEAANRSTQGQVALFVDYHRKTMTKADFAALWGRVREMFPGNPAWLNGKPASESTPPSRRDEAGEVSGG